MLISANLLHAMSMSPWFCSKIPTACQVINSKSWNSLNWFRMKFCKKDICEPKFCSEKLFFFLTIASATEAKHKIYKVGLLRSFVLLITSETKLVWSFRISYERSRLSLFAPCNCIPSTKLIKLAVSLYLLVVTFCCPRSCPALHKSEILIRWDAYSFGFFVSFIKSFTTLATMLRPVPLSSIYFQ